MHNLTTALSSTRQFDFESNLFPHLLDSHYANGDDLHTPILNFATSRQQIWRWAICMQSKNNLLWISILPGRWLANNPNSKDTITLDCCISQSPNLNGIYMPAKYSKTLFSLYCNATFEIVFCIKLYSTLILCCFAINLHIIICTFISVY